MDRHSDSIMKFFNAKVGGKQYEDTVGPHGLGKVNEKGTRLIEFCEKENRLFATHGLS